MLASGLLLPVLTDVIHPTSATAVGSTDNALSSTTSFIQPDDATITDKVFFNVRISRQDGTFYVRDDLPDTPENRVFYGTLVVGLFGKAAPRHVERFLSYVASSNPLDDNPMPSYGRSQFPSFDQSTGVLTGGKIPSLEYTEISGRSALKYGDRLLAANLWVEKPETGSARISHSAKGLLTHRLLDVMPTFDITTRSDTRVLDFSHQVFARILLDDSSLEFLKLVQDLPTYSVERPSSMADPSEQDLVQDAAKAVFDAQRGFFRGAAKSFGDGRVSKIYEGKLLRRVEVTQVGIVS